MEGLLQAHSQQEKKLNLQKASADIQDLIELLQNARDQVASNPSSATSPLGNIKNHVKKSFDKIEDDLKDVNRGLNHYQKALKEKFKNAALPTTANESLARQPDLIDRAIAMHLLREGQFDVAKTFVKEAGEQAQASDYKDTNEKPKNVSWINDLTDPDDIMEEEDGQVQNGSSARGGLQKKFAEMFNILDALRNDRDLEPAIDWARRHSSELELRGSNFEFELGRLKFVELYCADMYDTGDSFAGPLRAVEYARKNFASLSVRYAREISSLLGSLAFSPGLDTSPYSMYFYNANAFEEASESFTKEFCGLLGLSSQSPLFTAITAGGIAMPMLEKVERVMAQARGQWTSVNELPVETPLPPGFQFHSIFVCPVSRDQATDTNPPMMLPCGHVIAKESLDAHSKGKSRMKCPYCPVECHPHDAKMVYI